MDNFQREQLLEKFDTISSAVDYCRFLLDDEYSKTLGTDNLVDSIYPRLTRILETSDEIEDFIDFINKN